MELEEFHSLFVRNTGYRANIKNAYLIVKMADNDFCKTINVSSRMLKHVYDKRPAEEYDFFLFFMSVILNYPDFIYKNKVGVKGDLIFIKIFEDIKHMISVEFTETDTLDVVTFFRVYKENYLKNCELLWRRKDGVPSSYMPLE